MRIFIATSDDTYQPLTNLNSADYQRFPTMSAPAYRDTRALSSIEFCRLEPHSREGDFRGLGMLLTCRSAVLKKIQDTIQQDIEVIPIKVHKQADPSYLLNPIHVVDAIDMDVAHALMEKEGVKWVECYEFKKDFFRRPQFFIDNYLAPRLFYVTDLGNPDEDFYVRCNKLQLTGIIFKQVWEG